MKLNLTEIDIYTLASIYAGAYEGLDVDISVVNGYGSFPARVEQIYVKNEKILVRFYSYESRESGIRSIDQIEQMRISCRHG